MHILNLLFDFRNYRLGIRNHRVSTCHYGVCVRNHDAGIDCQLGLKGTVEFERAQEDELNAR